MKSLFRVESSEVFNDLKTVGIWTTGLSLQIPAKVNLILLYKYEYLHDSVLHFDLFLNSV